MQPQCVPGSQPLGVILLVAVTSPIILPSRQPFSKHRGEYNISTSSSGYGSRSDMSSLRSIETRRQKKYENMRQWIFEDYASSSSSSSVEDANGSSNSSSVEDANRFSNSSSVEDANRFSSSSNVEDVNGSSSSSSVKDANRFSNSSNVEDVNGSSSSSSSSGSSSRPEDVSLDVVNRFSSSRFLENANSFRSSSSVENANRFSRLEDSEQGYVFSDKLKRHLWSAKRWVDDAQVPNQLTTAHIPVKQVEGDYSPQKEINRNSIKKLSEVIKHRDRMFDRLRIAYIPTRSSGNGDEQRILMKARMTITQVMCKIYYQVNMLRRGLHRYDESGFMREHMKRSGIVDEADDVIRSMENMTINVEMSAKTLLHGKLPPPEHGPNVFDDIVQAFTTNGESVDIANPNLKCDPVTAERVTRMKMRIHTAMVTRMDCVGFWNYLVNGSDYLDMTWCRGEWKPQPSFRLMDENEMKLVTGVCYAK